eukprot:14047797-Ditylum_brightwellii.AAC.1
MEGGANLNYSHFKRFGLTIYTRENNQASKTEAVVFAAPGESFTDYDVSRVPVVHGYLINTCTFKHLGSILSWNPNDCLVIENYVLQAQKALQAMMPGVGHTNAVGINFGLCGDNRIQN